jgi:hypothetical protein
MMSAEAQEYLDAAKAEAKRTGNAAALAALERLEKDPGTLEFIARAQSLYRVPNAVTLP